jgi:16S rRNA (cytosine967-C5)-methyltransferase
VGISRRPSGTETPREPAPRSIALAALASVLDRRQPLEEALAETPTFTRLDQRDRAFARLLLSSSLRRLGQIDRIIDACLERPLAARARMVRHLLRLGVCQLLFLQTPPHAAVSTSVAIAAARDETAGYKGLLNAVLRRVDRERTALLARVSDPSLNTPSWLWRSWIDAYGSVAATAIAEAHLGEAPLDLTVGADIGSWRERLNANLLPTGSLRLKSEGPIEMVPGYAEGTWWVQDAAAALPARLLGEVKGQRVIDLCAAPGGKTAQLAAAGADVIAVDRSAVRLERVHTNLVRLRLNAQLIAADTATWRPDEPADAVLLDAPCSATGTIRRHPDVAWHRRPGDIAELAQLQDRLLRAAVAMAKRGGRIVFSTCSLQPEEGPARIAALLADDPAVVRLPIAPAEVGGLGELITADGDLRTLPFHLAAQGGMDGFYAARLQRR